MKKTHKIIFLLSHQKGLPISEEKHLYLTSQRKGSWKGHRSMCRVHPFATARCTTPKGKSDPALKGFFLRDEWADSFAEVRSVGTLSATSPKMQVKPSLLLADEIKPGQILQRANTALERGFCLSKN